jgi:AraC family transcriptional activator of mtrCDE
VFRMIELRGCVYFQRDFHAPWAMKIGGGAFAQFHIVLSGNAVIETRDDVRRIGPGELVLFPRGQAHVLADQAGRMPTSGREVMAAQDAGKPLFCEGGAATRLVCGHYEFAQPVLHPLIAGLPELIVLTMSDAEAGRSEPPILSLLIEESRKQDPGTSSVISRLAEVLLVQILRRFFTLNPEHIGFLAGGMDPRLSRAIVKIHREFDQALTVDALADRAGMSRSGFSEQFKAKTGLAPITYLTKWRMTSAAWLLCNPALPVAEVAYRNGYESDVAFMRAFRREYGVTPVQFREQRLARAAV